MSRRTLPPPSCESRTLRSTTGFRRTVRGPVMLADVVGLPGSPQPPPGGVRWQYAFTRTVPGCGPAVKFVLVTLTAGCTPPAAGGPLAPREPEDVRVRDVIRAVGDPRPVRTGVPLDHDAIDPVPRGRGG